MKRLICFTAVAALLCIPFVHSAFAKPKQKVAICHVSEDGNHHVIVVSQNAQKAHLKHGDCLITGATTVPKAGTPCCPTRLTIADDPATPEDESEVTTTCADPFSEAGACTFGTTP